VLDSKDTGLAAGQFVLARIDGLTSKPGIYIPVRAVLNTPDGAMVWAVDKDNKVQPHPLKLGDSVGNLVEVAEGLATGDRVIVDGILKVAPGAVVKPVAVDVTDPPGGPVAAPAPVSPATPPAKLDDQKAQAAPTEQKK
jgi:membrane fusion protein (multidrug efflux system)